MQGNNISQCSRSSADRRNYTHSSLSLIWKIPFHVHIKTIEKRTRLEMVPILTNIIQGSRRACNAAGTRWWCAICVSRLALTMRAVFVQSWKSVWKLFWRACLLTATWRRFHNLPSMVYTYHTQPLQPGRLCTSTNDIFFPATHTRKSSSHCCWPYGSREVLRPRTVQKWAWTWDWDGQARAVFLHNYLKCITVKSFVLLPCHKSALLQLRGLTFSH